MYCWAMKERLPATTTSRASAVEHLLCRQGSYNHRSREINNMRNTIRGRSECVGVCVLGHSGGSLADVCAQLSVWRPGPRSRGRRERCAMIKASLF